MEEGVGSRLEEMPGFKQVRHNLKTALGLARYGQTAFVTRALRDAVRSVNALAGLDDSRALAALRPVLDELLSGESDKLRAALRQAEESLAAEYGREAHDL
ncbi:MAG: hypothetical protein ACYC5Y_13075 [Symbiobacteriia bacterium]